MDFMAAVKKQETTPAPAHGKDPFDQSNISASISDIFNTAIQTLEADAIEHQVTGKDSYYQAIEMTGQAKKLASAINKKRAKVKDPYLKMCRFIDGFCRPMTDKLDEITRTLSAKILPYTQELECRRREDQATARKKAQAEQKKLAAENPGEPIPTIIPEVIPSEIKTTTDSGSATLKTEFKGTIIDIKKLPIACIESRWQYIEKAIQPWVNTQIKAGAREIPGVKIEEIARVDVRTRR